MLRSIEPRVSASAVPTIHHQGSLDGLCGLYCLINSMSLQLGERIDCADVFAMLLRSLGTGMHAAATSGMTTAQLVRMLRRCIGYLAKQGVRMQFRRAFARKPPLSKYWQDLQAHHRAHGAGSIVVGMIGEYDHWSCIQAVEPHCLRFADSDALTDVPRACITIGAPSRARPFGLIAEQTFLIDYHCERNAGA